MSLTFDQAVEEHRKMWNWIAENIRIDKTSIHDMKILYFSNLGTHYTKRPSLCCFCCDYSGTMVGVSKCQRCPIEWGNNSKRFMCEYDYSVYMLACEAAFEEDYVKAAEYAKQVAELPARAKRDDDL